MRRRSIKLALLLVLVVAFAGSATAFLTSTGVGIGSTSVTATTDPVTISAATPAAKLYPGASSDVAVHLANPNGSAANIASLVLDASKGTNGFQVDSDHVGCNTAALSFTSQDNGGDGYTAAAHGSLDVHLADAVTMDEAAANACQGASFSVYLKAGS
jgi:hypothetical protein